MPGTAKHNAFRVAALVALLALALTSPSAAQASYKTLSRSLSNIMFGPMDVLLSPVVAGKAITTNLQDIDDTTGVRVAYTVPGFFWYTGVIIGAGVLRTATGILEFIPGLILWPFETDLDPLMDPVDDAGALVDVENDFNFQIKFGIDYTRAD